MRDRGSLENLRETSSVLSGPQKPTATEALQGQDLAIRILALLNQPGNERATIERILHLVKEFSGLESVGIRLRAGEDFPYFVTSGFPDHFVEREASLCARNEAGDIIRDARQKPVLECMCGKIISGQTDPSLPVFTPGGSFWINSRMDFLTYSREQDHQTVLRNRCIEEGYESVALIPLRRNGEIIGLMQLNDSRADYFTPDVIEYYEGIGAAIGIVLARISTEEALADALEELRRSHGETQSLLECSQALLRHQGFQQSARSIYDSCKALLGANAGYVVLLSVNGSENELVLLDPDGISCGVDRSLPIPIRGLRGEALRTGTVIYDNDFPQNTSSNLLPPGHAPLDNVMFAPLLIEGTVVGLLGLANKPGGFNDHDARLASVFAKYAAIALRNSRALDSLERSEERFRAIVETANDAIIAIDASWRVVLWNRQAERMFGYSADEMVDKPLTRIIPDRYRPAHLEGLERMSSTGLSKLIGKTIELYGLKADGTEFPLELSLGSWRSDAETFITAIIRDVTDRKRAEEALREAHDELEKRVEQRTSELSRANEELKRQILEYDLARAALRVSEDRFRALFESAQDCIAIKDTDLRYILVNPAMERLCGRRASEIIGRKAEDIFGKEAGKHVREADLRTLQGESIEEEHTRPIGGIRLTFHDIRVPLRDAHGAIIGICCISRDITERKRVVPHPGIPIRNYSSRAMRFTLSKARHAAATDAIILLQGESGSGKDYLARWIHDHSGRSDGPFFAINCAAVSQAIAESELFGHERGAFTGARGRKRGLLELAEGGTLLLNEIGELPLSLQSKLLAFLDTRTFLRVGGESSIRINARLIAATHRDLEGEMNEGRFLKPLYYRLNVFTIQVPPLRERREDIPLLAQDILLRLSAEMQLPRIPRLDEETSQAFTHYHWPGNVRELRNMLERALILSDPGKLEVPLPLEDPSPHEWRHTVTFPSHSSLKTAVDEVIQALCVEALRRCGGTRTETARLLSISRDSLYRYMRRFRIEPEDAS